MSTNKSWKVGDQAYMNTNLSGPLVSPILVRIMKIDSEGIHNIKVCEVAEPSQIYYCNAKGLSKRKAQAERNKCAAISEEIKQEAEERTAKRMEEIKDKIGKQNLPTFQDLMMKARACFLTIEQCKTEEALIMANLAQKQLYREMKNGCVWKADECEVLK